MIGVWLLIIEPDFIDDFRAATDMNCATFEPNQGSGFIQRKVNETVSKDFARRGIIGRETKYNTKDNTYSSSVS